jgi:hypothetical protein
MNCKDFAHKNISKTGLFLFVRHRYLSDADYMFQENSVYLNYNNTKRLETCTETQDILFRTLLEFSAK